MFSWDLSQVRRSFSVSTTIQTSLPYLSAYAFFPSHPTQCLRTLLFNFPSIDTNHPCHLSSSANASCLSRWNRHMLAFRRDELCPAGIPW